MKPKLLIVGSIILLLAAIVVVFLSQNTNLFSKEYPILINSTPFSPEGEKIKLGIAETIATKDTLALTLTLSGIDLGENFSKFDHIICDPWINTKENVEVTFKSREVIQGDPLQVTYIFQLQGNNYRTLNVDMDWTIGPCDTALNESNVTPVAEPLLTIIISLLQFR
jgi:hypothetical protein